MLRIVGCIDRIQDEYKLKKMSKTKHNDKDLLGSRQEGTHFICDVDECLKVVLPVFAPVVLPLFVVVLLRCIVQDLESKSVSKNDHASYDLDTKDVQIMFRFNLI